ncbi:MAG: hypothetical protein IT168_12830 [Bryobacterales bacterium]|nr:hypothetical protein [Bryobacterales bacterium]
MVSREGVASYVTYVVNQFQKPEVFRTATGEALVIHATDFTLVTRERPARAGELLVLYATGLGWVDPPVRDGDASPASPLSLTRYDNMVVTVNGRFVTPLFSGLAPGLVGIFQVNFMLPADTPHGENMIGIRFGTPLRCGSNNKTASRRFGESEVKRYSCVYSGLLVVMGAVYCGSPARASGVRPALLEINLGVVPIDKYFGANNDGET